MVAIMQELYCRKLKKNVSLHLAENKTTQTKALMKKLLPLLLFVGALFFSLSNANASHVAAGQIDVLHNDTNWVPCTFPDNYIVNARFYRECSGIDAPPSLTLTVQSTCYGATTYTLDPYSIVTATDTIGGGRELASNCIQGEGVPCTEEYIYRYYNPDGSFNVPLPGACRDWSFSWSVNARPGNNENVNGGTFFVETKINNTFPCDTVVTGATGIPPNDTCINNTSYNSSAIFNDDRPIVTFCVAKSYKYFIGATDPDGDSLAYRMVNPQSASGVPVGFTAGYSVNDPIPVVNRPVDFDGKNGVLTFTPAQAFTGAFAYVAEEWRDSCFVDSIFVNGDSVAIIATKKVLVGETMRDTRIIFGVNCITSIPNFGNDPKDPNNPIDENTPPLFSNSIILNCAATEFVVQMNIALQCNTLEPGGSDFRIVEGTPENPTAIIAIDSALTIGCVNNEFTRFKIKLFEPIGPGDYKLFFKTGDDFNTLQTKCGIDVPEFTSIDITVVDNFSFELDFDSIFVCRPADPAAIATANFDNASFYAWSFEGNPIGGDSLQNQVVDSNGTWTVEVNVKGCDDTDDFYVDITKNRPVIVPDYYLCPEEIDTLMVRLDTVPQGSNHTWYWLNDKTGAFEIVSTQDIFNASSFDRGGFFYSEVTLNNICTTEDTFEISTDLLRANIGRDSTICFNNAYWLYNRVQYKKPEEHTFQWFLDGNELVGQTNDSLFITGEGSYRFEVTRRGICTAVDSVYINVAEELARPDVVCSKVTFERGQIKQTFYWDPVEGADRYDVQEIYSNGGTSDWIPSNGQYGIHHITFGAQAQLLVRAVNDEVPVGASCKYSEVDGAEACEVVVKPTNVFTPNGDGVNDFLTFDLVEIYPGSNLQIFNRWGKKIYEDNDYYNDWTGEDFKAGTYFYVLDINDPSQGILKGTFTILR